MLIILLTLVPVSVQEWTPENYPHFQDYKKCKMDFSSNVCDPDEVYDKSGRLRLHYAMGQIKERTASNDNNWCTRKGMDVILAIAKQGTQQLANGLRDSWSMDNQCKNSAVFLWSSNTRQLYFARRPNAVLNDADFQAILKAHSKEIQTGSASALANIFKEIGKPTRPASAVLSSGFSAFALSLIILCNL